VTLEQEELHELNVGSYLVNAEIVRSEITQKLLVEQFVKQEFRNEVFMFVQLVGIEHQHFKLQKIKE